MMKHTQTYQIESQWHWFILGSKPHFNQFRFEVDSSNQLWFVPEPTNFLQSEVGIGIGKAYGGLMQTELAIVEKRSDNRLTVGLRMYINLFSVYLLRVQGWSFIVNNLVEEDYALLNPYKDGAVSFLHKL